MSSASAFLIKQQTDALFICREVLDSRRWKIPARFKFHISIHVTISGSARGLTMHVHLIVTKKQNMPFGEGTSGTVSTEIEE